MIKKWDINPDPTGKNKDRHKLLVNGQMKDIFYIVKNLGSVCSRPEKNKGEFNFTMYLSKVDNAVLNNLKSVVAELSKPESEQREGPKSFETPKPKAAEVSAESKESKIVKPPKKKAEPSKPAEPKREEKPPQKKEEAKAEKPPEAKKEEKPPEKKAEPPKPAVPRMGISVPSASTRLKKEESAAPEKKTPEKEDFDKAEEKIRGRLLKTKWSLELPLNPMFNFENLVAGSHNRFAHAAAMAVIDNPGVMYNPLLIFGVSGSGKTHFVHATSYGLSAALGQQKVYVTDAIRFSKAIDIAVKDKFVDKLESMFRDIHALVIDDIHLFLLSEKNAEVISKILSSFLENNKQLIFTSLFPPKSLEGLEENLGFQVTQGWMVDLKIPNTENYKLIIKNMLEKSDVQLEDEDVDFYFAGKMMALGDAEKVIGQVKKLEKMIVNPDNELGHGELLKMLLGGMKPSGESPTEDDFAQSYNFKLAGDNNWFKWGVFCPKGYSNEAKWAVYSLHEKAKEIGIPIEWEQVFIEEYDSDETYGVPFKIGDAAVTRKVNGLIIIGPQKTSALGSNEENFRHITNKITGSFFVKCAWIKSDQLKDPDAYVKILMDLI